MRLNSLVLAGSQRVWVLEITHYPYTFLLNKKYQWAKHSRTAHIPSQKICLPQELLGSRVQTQIPHMMGYSYAVRFCRDISLEALEVLFLPLVLLQIALGSRVPACLVMKLPHNTQSTASGGKVQVRWICAFSQVLRQSHLPPNPLGTEGRLPVLQFFTTII